MKGIAKNQPSNHVEWANGFKSNMPDWITARHCALVDRLLWWIKEARTVLLTIERPGAFVGDYDREKYQTVIVGVMDVIAEADGLETLRAALVSKPFPKPPGM